MLFEDQLATFKMLLIGTPFESVCDVLALLVQWAVNCPVSIPAAFRLSIQHLKVPRQALLKGFLKTGFGKTS